MIASGFAAQRSAQWTDRITIGRVDQQLITADASQGDDPSLLQGVNGRCDRFFAVGNAAAPPVDRPRRGPQSAGHAIDWA